MSALLSLSSSRGLEYNIGSQNQLERTSTLYSRHFLVDEAVVALSGHDVGQNTATVHDKWINVNHQRAFVAPALNLALSEILSKYAPAEGCAIFELGSGYGYSLSGSLSERIIRTQPSLTECQLLKTTTSEPVYQLSILDLCELLQERRKNVPLFFALNVFDCMSEDERRLNFTQMAVLQGSGDRILVLLDTNPEMANTIKFLENRNPGHAALPYFPSTGDKKLTFLLVPVQYIPFDTADIDWLDLLNSETLAYNSGIMTPLQTGLNALKGRIDLKYVYLNEVYTELVQSELDQLGYRTRSYYHSAFAPGPVPQNTSRIAEDLIYRSLGGIGELRQWSTTDPVFLQSLAFKKQPFPAHINESFLAETRANGQKLLGTEVLVIEAVKN